MKRTNPFPSTQAAKRRKSNSSSSPNPVPPPILPPPPRQSLPSAATELHHIMNEVLERGRKNSHFVSAYLHLLEYSKKEELGSDLTITPYSVIGLSGSGKTTLIDALVGSRLLNPRPPEVTIPTRRPVLINLQCVSSLHSEVLQVQVGDPATRELGPVIPTQNVPYEIHRLTKEVCGDTGVNSEPIVMFVQKRDCLPMSIFDTPGLPKQSTDYRFIQVDKTLRRSCEAPRIIICVLDIGLSSTNPYADELLFNLVRQLDPTGERTIFVHTKFDMIESMEQHQRVKVVREMLEQYGKYEDPPHFYVGLRGTRIRHEEDFVTVMCKTHGDDCRRLRSSRAALPLSSSSAGGPPVSSSSGMDIISDEDEEDEQEVEEPALGFRWRDVHDRCQRRVGVWNLRIHLENRILSVLRRKMAAVLDQVAERMKDAEAEHEKTAALLQRVIEENQTTKRANSLMESYLKSVREVLLGRTHFDPAVHGETLVQEKVACPASGWPNYDLEIPIRGEHLFLLGASQLKRLLSEFEVVVLAQEFPETSDDEIMVTLGLDMDFSPIHGANDLADRKAKESLLPLLNTLCGRATYVVKRCFELCARAIIEQTPDGDSVQGFLKTLESACVEFVKEIADSLKNKVTEQFAAFTKIADCMEHITGSHKQGLNYNLLNPTPDDTIGRVRSLMEGPRADDILPVPQSRYISPADCQKVRLSAAKIFSGIRDAFSKYVPAKFRVFFFDPLLSNLDPQLRRIVQGYDEEILRGMMGDPLPRLQEKAARGAARLAEMARIMEIRKLLSS